MQLAAVFLNVIVPVFALVVIGYVAGPRLKLEARTLSRLAYYILVPAFVFNVIGSSEMDATTLGQMVIYILTVVILTGALGFAVAKLLGRSAVMVAAYILVAVFGNVGNFGLPLIEFRYGSEALAPATVYFVVIAMASFAIGVAATSFVRGGSARAALSVLTTPALLALPPALLVSGLDIQVPLAISRIVGLLAAAMVPIMLLSLGVQLATGSGLHVSLDVVAASSVRLIGGPLIAAMLAIPFGITGLERSAGIIQAGMPAAVFSSIIAFEYDCVPEFVTSTVLVSTLASVFTLTVLLSIV
ncbi:MAG: AEC family transporter [Caldilineales bacterium]|nr:AEC family transporter [Caldilineales bacterium]